MYYIVPVLREGTCHSLSVEVMGQFADINFLHLCGSQRSKSGHQTLWQALLPIEPSYWLQNLNLLLIKPIKNILSKFNFYALLILDGANFKSFEWQLCLSLFFFSLVCSVHF